MLFRSSGFSLVSLNLNSALVALQGELEMAVYLDAGPDGQLTPEVGEVLLVAQEVPRALARL